MSSSDPNLQELSGDQRRALLDSLLRDQSAKTRVFPASFAQRRMWFLDRMDVGAAYNLPNAFRLRGPLDVDALERSLNAIVERHEILRTTFAAEGGVPRQVVAPALRIPLVVRDLTDTPEADREAAARAIIAEAGQRPFDLGEGPLVRALLVRLNDDEHVLQVTTHHIVSDAWSQGILRRELAEHYRAYCEGEEPDLPSLPMQYGDFAAEQSTRLAGDELDRQVAYWKSHLGDGVPPLDLPTDRPRPAVQTFAGAAVGIAFTPEETAAIEAFARRNNVTLAMLLLAAFQVLLSRYTGQDDIAVGSPIANRNSKEIEDLIGFFVNTLVLRTDLSGDPTFAELLDRVKDVSLGAYENQDLPFERLVDEVAPDRDMSRSPLVQVVLAVQNVGVENLRLADLEIEPYGQESVTTRFDLEVLLSVTTGGLNGRICYNPDLFDRATMSRMAGHFQNLLRGVVADPTRRISELPMLDDAERRALLAGWDDASEIDVPDRCLHELFEAQAARSPEATAVTFGDATLTYGELNERANRVAHRLRSEGAGPDVLVGLCAERGFDMIVGLLGILKSGAAYVPLDPTYPASRLEFMIDDARMPILLASSHLVESLPADHTTVVALESEACADEPATNLPRAAAPSNLAYVIYTSGSTGQPKGVLVEHRHVSRLFVATAPWFEFDETDVWTLFHSYAFDFSVWEIWGALLHGGRLVLVPYEVSRSPAEFLELVHREKVTVLNQTPSAFRQLIAADERAENGEVSSIRLVIFGGEALELQSLRPWIDRHGDERPRLVNMYGITETTVHVTYRRITRRDLEEAPGSVIGQPIPDLRVCILDAAGQPVPIGVPGELHVGGAGVARGYLDRPELTAQRFVPDPFASASKTRLYRTGDVGRRLANGDIEYLGRNDEQVKIRGFRIELGEIEAALGRDERVREAVVVLLDAGGDADGKRLVAYVVVDDPADASLPATLRSLVSDRLPSYMVPAAIVPLDALPLTAHGKLDRRALPTPSMQRQTERRFVAPRNPEEEVIAQIWTTLLGLAEVGIHDGFFELGGHSLLATQVVSRMRDVLDVEIPLREFFERGTIADLAAFARGRRPDAAAPITLVPRDVELPLSFAQRRLWFLDQMGAGAAYNMPWAFHLDGELDEDALERALARLVERHETLRTYFPAQDGNPVQAIHPSLPASLPRVDLSAMDEDARWEDVHRRHHEEAGRPFDLTQGPLFRWSLLRLGEQEHVLLLSLHHIISDGWSMGVLTRDLGALYDAFAHGQSSPLADLPIQYADFSVWQHAWLQGEVRQGQLDFWSEQLAGAEELQLPTDYRRGAGQTFRGSREQLELPAELCEELDELCRREGVTLFMPLMAAFAAMLQRASGQDDIVVGSPIANRTRTELEDLIGFFVNSLVMRTDLSGNPTLRELLARVKETTLAAYERQDLPFEWLVNELQPDRDLNRNPLFQVMFALQNAPQRPLELGDLTIKVFAPSRNTRFDIEGHAYRTQEGLTTIFIYNRDLFTPATIRRMLDHFRTMLETLVRDGRQRVDEVRLLSDEQRDTIVNAWNQTATAFPKDESVPALFARQLQRAPEAAALKFDDTTLTYAELNGRANQIAHALRRRGVTTGSMVGIFAERGADLIVGLLGILKAGGAYIPLDPDYPPGRLALMVEETGASVLLTQESMRDVVPGYGGSILCFDTHHAEIAAEPTHDLPWSEGGSRPTDLAYVIYTSGSTGRPKGVCVQHRSIARLVCGTDYVELGPADRVAQASNASFDAATFEIWGALLNGATLVGLTRDEVLAPDVLARRLREEGITTLFLTTALFNQTVRMVPRAFESLRTLLFGGELVDPAQVRTVLRDGPPERLLHVYGPTETTTFATWHHVRGVPEDAVTVPIGRPLANTTAYVLAAHGQPVPVGLPGELFIGGDGVARGYLDQTEATAGRFVPDPFSDDPGARLYRTGDWVRYDADGAIAFIGRRDGQVKLRGFRIEVGEIDAALIRHPAVRNAIVLVREDQPGERSLAAYIVLDEAGLIADAPSSVGEWGDEHVADWLELYEQTYGKTPDNDDATLNLAGWNSSYTGEAIPEAHMQEWVDATIDRIRGLYPGRVLEIGCGTGLLLSRVAPHCERYLGTDFSPSAMMQLAQLTRRPELEHVELSRRMADDFTGIEPASFDTAVINSVTQYLPDIDYLRRVLEGVAEAIAPGGHIMVGDVRNLRVLEAFHASVELHRADGTRSVDQLAHRIRYAVEHDGELVIHPDFFRSLVDTIPRISDVEILLKRGLHQNEMTRFRYDVVLHVEAAERARPVERWATWERDVVDLDALRRLLADEGTDAVGVRGVPNARLVHATALMGRLAETAPTTAVGEFRAAADPLRTAGIEPNVFWSIAAETGHAVELTYAEGDEGRLDVVFRRAGRTAGAPPFLELPREARTAATGASHANYPLKAKLTRDLMPTLREFAKRHVPEYMVPTAFVVMNELPLTPNGKVDRRALPAPGQVRAELGGDYVAPQSDVEKSLTEIWADVLRLDRVGVHDDFFDLGGHSLMATQVVSRVRTAFGVDLPLQTLFESPTVAELAEEIETVGWLAGDGVAGSVAGDVEEGTL